MQHLDTTSAQSHTAFAHSVDPVAARHQLRMSLGVAVALAISTGVCLVSLNPARAVEPKAPTVLSLVQGG